MANPNSYRALRAHIKRTIYTLKRRWGATIDVYQVGPSAIDPKTGKRNQAKTTFRVRQAVVLPTLTHRDFTYSIQFIRANSNFVQGGWWEDGDRGFIIDGDDLIGRTILQNDYIIFDNERYDVKNIQYFEQQAGCLIQGRKVATNAALRTTELSLNDPMILSSDFTETRSNDHALIDQLTLQSQFDVQRVVNQTFSDMMPILDHFGPRGTAITDPNDVLVIPGIT